MSKKKVLVVDDDETIIAVENIVLHDEYDVTTANSGDAAVDLIEKGFVPDLILLDLYMSGMGGWSTLLKIHSLCDINETRIAIYTSSEDPEGIAKANEYGAVDYILKSVKGIGLLERVEKLIN